VGQELLERLEVEWLPNVVKVDLNHELVSLQRPKPLNPTELARMVWVLGECALIKLFFAL